MNAAAPEDSDVRVCTSAEAQAVVKADSDAWLVDGERIELEDTAARDRAKFQSRAAIGKVLNRIRNGEQFEEIVDSEGCV